MTDNTTSWSGSLHDGYLEKFSTSADDRAVTLKVRIDHLADDEASGRGSHFAIRLNTVRAVHVTAWESWGPLSLDQLGSADPETQNEALLQGRMVSIAAEDFADSGLRIVDAIVYETLAKDLVWPLVTFTEPDTPVKLLTVDVDGGESQIGDRGIAVIFDYVEVFREGRPIALEDFLALGESYWRKFRERSERQNVES